MADKDNQSILDRANSAFLAKRYDEALALYDEAIAETPELANSLSFNIQFAQKKLGLTGKERLSVKPVPKSKPAATTKATRKSAGSANAYADVFNSLSESRDFTDELKAFWKQNQQAIKQFVAENKLVDKPLVSVIMPAYNRGDMLSNSVLTALQQTYSNFELIICDDGSTDNTRDVVAAFDDPRIHYIYQDNAGAAAARNTALSHAQGDIITYLDTDNYWHPEYLKLVVLALQLNSGRSSVYFDFIDYRIDKNHAIHIKPDGRPEFNHESLLKKPFIDLNTFAHKRELYDAFGGFDESLSRRQDYDVMLKYTWLRDPLHVKLSIALYQRNEHIEQITRLKRGDNSPVSIINQKIENYLANGLSVNKNGAIKKVSVIIWDICRNHFSKPFSVAEALAENYEVELISFDFFNEGVFEPLREVNPRFTTKYFNGADFPDFFAMLRAGMDAVTGDVMYVVKPRLPSLGLAMLVNYERGIPLALEINDLETVVNSPKEGDKHEEVLFKDVNLADKELLNPYSGLWSNIFDPISKQLPVLITHNQGLDGHYGNRTLYMRNLKDEQVYDPGRYDRERIREELGFKPDDRIILFGGLLRKHKGIYELVELVEKLKDKRYKLLFVGSRPTPDQAKLVEQFKDVITVLPPQDRVGMARINYAADLVILWLNPEVPASHYQFPYKASDAFAMETPVIANNISDLGDLARQGYITEVPFGDWTGMVKAINKLFSNDKYRTAQVKAARRLFLRQFSFNAARGNFELINRRLVTDSVAPYKVSVEFAERFNAFYRAVTKSKSEFLTAFSGKNLRLINSFGVNTPADFGAIDVDERVSFVAEACANSANTQLPRLTSKVLALVLATDMQRALQSARLLAKRADYAIDVVVLEVTDAKQPSLVALQNLLSASSSSCVLVCDDYAFPCRDWLEFGYSKLRKASFDWVFANSAVRFNTSEAHELPEYLLINKPALTETLSQQAGLQITNVWQQLGAFARSSKRVSHSGRCLIANMAELERSPRTLTNGSEIHLVDIKNLDNEKPVFHEDICVVMPCINHELGLRTADLLQSRAGIRADYVVAVDTKRQGFIKTLNQVARCSTARYVVYLAEDAFPGEDWLKLAFDTLESSGKGLLAFNCGKWHGRVAAFGMVRKAWISKFYSGAILFDAYKSHRADNEIAVLAKAEGQFAYEANSVLIENDARKDFKRFEADAANFSADDRELFKSRYKNVLSTMVNPAELDAMFDHYFNQRKLAAAKQAMVIS